ncbi:MAG: choice-of-anchor J domain-containing protein [Bacteroidia bacterium]
MKKFTLIFMLLISLRGLAQLPLQDFEGTWTSLSGTSSPAGPDGWYIRNERGPIQRWIQADGSTDRPAHSGTRAAYLNRENVADGTTTEDWLITSQFPVPLNAQLKFWSRLTEDNDQGTVYKIFIGTDPTNTATFTEIQSWTELQINPAQTTYTEKVVDIPASYTGSQYYIAFVMQGDNGDRWLIDDVQVVTNCIAPTTLGATPAATSAVLTWAGNAPNYEVEVVAANGTRLETGTVVSGNSFTTPENLSPSTAYVFYVRSVCGTTNMSAWTGPFPFTTTQIPAILTFTDGFEVTPSQWSLVNGTQTNKWTIGTAALAVNAGAQALYISNNTTTNAYGYNNAVASTVQAYRDVFIPAGAEELNLAFNWKCIGERVGTPGNYNYADYLNVYLAPADYNPVAGVQTNAATKIAGSFAAGGLNWNNFSGTVPVSGMGGTVRRLIFEWKNDAGGGTSSTPAAIDNINLSLATCPSPSNLTLVSTNQNSASFTWTAPATVTPTYDFYFAPVNTAPVATTTPTANVPNASLTLNSLANLTTYYIWVRSNCGNGDTSAWVGPLAFNTTQVPATLPLVQDFENTTPAPGFGFTTVTSSQNKWVVGSAVSNGGTRSLYVTNDNGVSNAYSPVANTYVHAFRDILIPAGTNEISVAFDWKSLGEACCDNMRVWVVPTAYIPVGGTQLTAAATNGVKLTGNVANGNFGNNNTWTNSATPVNVSAYSGRICRLVFEWANDGSTTNQPPAAVDNLNIQVVTCARPTGLTVAPSGTSASLSWTPGGTETEWEVFVTPATGGTVPSASTIGTPANTNTNFVYGPLTTVTAYNYYVRAVCSGSDKSLWVGPIPFSTTIANDNCSGAVTLNVSPGENCTTPTPGRFTGATPSTVPTCTGISGPDVWYKFTATGTSHIVSLSEIGPAFDNNLADPTRGLVLSVYENACDDLNVIACSIVNYVRVKDLVPGQTYFVRVTQNTTTPNPAMSYNICVRTPAPPVGGGNAADCLITTVNFSFEDPVRTTSLDNLNPIMYSHNQIQGWRTTANDHVMEFWPTPNSESMLAYDGIQFIEINANENQGTMGVYQDFTTPSPTTFTVKFAHRGRKGTDTMEVLAGDASQPISTYTQIGGRTFSTGRAAWVYYGADNSLTYTVPDGQTVTRFFFRAVSTSTGDTSVGNFLDAITFTADNSIISQNVSIACGAPPVQIRARGDGYWSAHTDNPGDTTIANSRANSTTISGFSTPGVYMYDWITSYCTSTYQVTYTAPAIALPTTTQDTYAYCEGATATTLAATADTGYTVRWYDVATDGTPLAGAPTPVTTTPGTFMYYASQWNGTCEGPRLPFTITVNATPAAPVATGATYCLNATATPLTATADTGNTLNWYTVATNGTASATAPTPDTSVSATTTYYVSQSTTGGCESPRTAITITVSSAITQPTGFTLSAATVCIAGTNPVATPDATATLGGRFTSDSTSLVIDPTTGVIDLALSTAGNYNITYTVLADPANCLALSSTTLPLSVTPLSAPGLVFNYTQPICKASANVLPSQTPATAGGRYTSSDPTLLVVDAVTGEINVAASTAGTYTVTYTTLLDAVNCVNGGTSTPVTVTINALTTPAITINYPTVCGLEATLAPVAPTLPAGGVFSTTDSRLSLNSSTGVIDVANSTPGTYTITYALAQNNATCTAGVSIPLTVVITTPTVAGASFSYANASVCAGSANLTVIPGTGYTTGGTFSSTTGLSLNTATGEINVAGSTPGQYDITYTVAQNLATCTSGDSNQFRVTITQASTPVVGFNYDPDYCFGTGTVTPGTDTGFVWGGNFTISGGLTINAATGQVSLAGVAPGSYTVRYEVAANPAACSAANSDSFTFTLHGEIEAVTDGNCQGPNFIVTVSPENSSYNPATVSYEWTTTSGQIVGDNSETFNASAYIRTLGSTGVVYPLTVNVKVTAGNCSVTVPYVIDGITCQIQRGISPGGTANENDFFDLSGFGVKKLSIFNRYGLEVYSRNNYLNEWSGQTNNGEELPTGTYFYMMDSDSTGQKTGWIYINRQN